jgi:outer membrane lipoprotein carrier protein
MNRILLCVSSVIFYFAASIVMATPTSDFISMLNGVQSMKAGFTQTVYDNHGKATQKSYGSMAMQRPGKFRWDVTKPVPQLIIANQTKLWIYDPDLEQVTIRLMNKAAGESPALLLSHDNASLENSFAVQSIQRDASQRWFALTPKHKGNMFESIQMGFANNNNQIQEMRLKDNLGHLTVVQFKNIQLNVNTPASLFSFKPSAKIDVIDETRKK